MDKENQRRRLAAVLGNVMTMALACSGCAHPFVAALDAFQAAKKRGDYDEAAKYLADDARIWHVKMEGPGQSYTVKGGPWKDWDREFNGRSTREHVCIGENSVSYLSTETNDFYRLIERPPASARITYYFDDNGRITGMFYEPLNRDSPGVSDRQAEFEQWAAKRYPGLLDSPEMKMPNNPRRWRALLIEWRADVGLPPID